MASPDAQPAAQTQLQQRRRSLATTTRRGIGWLYWIAGVSVLNTLLYRSGVDWGFVIGLAATQLVDGFSAGLAKQAGSGSQLPLLVGACVIDAFLAGVFILAAKLAERGQRWPLLGVLAFYALDSLVFALSQAWFPLLFHGFALWAVGHAFLAMGELNRLPQDEPAAPAAAATAAATAPSAYFPSDPPESPRPAAAVGTPPLSTILLGGVPEFGAPDPNAPAATGLSTRVTGKPALVIGVVVLGVVIACVYTVCKYCDDAVLR